MVLGSRHWSLAGSSHLTNTKISWKDKIPAALSLQLTEDLVAALLDEIFFTDQDNFKWSGRKGVVPSLANAEKIK